MSCDSYVTFSASHENQLRMLESGDLFIATAHQSGTLCRQYFIQPLAHFRHCSKFKLNSWLNLYLTFTWGPIKLGKIAHRTMTSVSILSNSVFEHFIASAVEANCKGVCGIQWLFDWFFYGLYSNLVCSSKPWYCLRVQFNYPASKLGERDVNGHHQHATTWVPLLLLLKKSAWLLYLNGG